MSKRLEILKGSLEKKKAAFQAKLDAHFADVRAGNGQPMNDKRNGRATMNRWDKQNDSLRNLQDEISKTEKAIEQEMSRVASCEDVKSTLPAAILDRINDNTLTQWRKHPNFFFVVGVDKARIVWDAEGKFVSHRYVGEIKDKDQHVRFAQVFNALKAVIAASHE